MWGNKQQVYCYRTPLQDDQNECLQKLVPSEKHTSLLCLSYSIEKAASTFWQNLQRTKTRAKKWYCRICLYSIEMLQYLINLILIHRNSECKLYIVIMKDFNFIRIMSITQLNGKFFQEKKTTQNVLLEGFAALHACLKEFGINLKCLLWL